MKRGRTWFLRAPSAAAVLSYSIAMIRGGTTAHWPTAVIRLKPLASSSGTWRTRIFMTSLWEATRERASSSAAAGVRTSARSLPNSRASSRDSATATEAAKEEALAAVETPEKGDAAAAVSTEMLTISRAGFLA